VLQKCKVDIRFSPTLSDEDICQEAANLIVADLERKTAEEQLKASEQEKDAVPQEIPVIYSFLVRFSRLSTFSCQTSDYA